MGRYTIEQRVKVIQAYYENGRSNQNAYRALRDFFGQFNRPNVRTIGKIVQKFEQTGSVGDVKTPVYARTARTAENIAAVRDSVAEEPSTSTRRRAQQLNLSRSSLMNIMHKDLHLQLMSEVPLITLNNGTKMQAFGLGTYTSLSGDCERSVKDAIDAGYRHFDTAYFYENEAEVGKAIKEKITEGAVKREDVFIVTKLWCHFHDPERVEYACRKSLKNLGLDYVDCYLMHWPYGYEHEGDDVMFPTNAKGDVVLSDVDYIDTWKAMEKLVDLGLTKSIGVSNFNSGQIKRLLTVAKIKPVHNQVECHPALNQKKLIELCKQHDIIVTAYCPLGRPDPARKHPKFLFDSKVKDIADKYEKTPAQIVLRYLVEIGAVPVPKSVTRERIQQNIQIFDFKLNESDHKVMDSFNTGDRLIPMDHAKKSKYYPFNIEF